MQEIKWTAPEYIHTDKTSDWYWIVGIISITIALISIILNNVIFAILIIISGFTLSLFSSRKPQNIEIKIDGQGVVFGKIFYPYKNLESFFIETKDNYPRILLKSKSYISPMIKILIHPDDENEIENILLSHIPKEDMTESIFEKLLIYFGF